MWNVTKNDDVLGSLTMAQRVLQKGELPDNEEFVEMNTGVQCPGETSLEPFVGSVMTLEDKSFLDEAILCEIGDQFVYKFKK